LFALQFDTRFSNQAQNILQSIPDAFRLTVIDLQNSNYSAW